MAFLMSAHVIRLLRPYDSPFLTEIVKHVGFRVLQYQLFAGSTAFSFFCFCSSQLLNFEPRRRFYTDGPGEGSAAVLDHGSIHLS